MLKDVELNFTATGFLDTETFQIHCILGEEPDRLAACKEKLINELMSYKEKYDREAFARRMHQDFLPFLKPTAVSDEMREKWRVFYTALSQNRTRLVYEKQNGNEFEGAYRLRAKDLIYRVQRVE